MNEPTVEQTAWQRQRINALRAASLLLVPLVLWSRPAWTSPVMLELLEIAGILLIVTGVIGRLWAILYIGGRKSHVVLQDGPYSICRHPLYLFSSIAAAGFGLMLGSLLLGAVIGSVVFIILYLTAWDEEAGLRKAFGDEYRRYAEHTPRVMPDLSRFRTEPVITVNIATLYRNFRDNLLFLALIPLAHVAQWFDSSGVVTTFPLY